MPPIQALLLRVYPNGNGHGYHVAPFACKYRTLVFQVALHKRNHATCLKKEMLRGKFITRKWRKKSFSEAAMAVSDCNNQHTFLPLVYTEYNRVIFNLQLTIRRSYIGFLRRQKLCARLQPTKEGGILLRTSPQVPVLPGTATARCRQVQGGCFCRRSADPIFHGIPVQLWRM